MLGRLIGRIRRPGRGAAPVPKQPFRPESPVYAVGDIHGRADLLEDLAGQILTEAADSGARPQVVFLGDYVDRGEQSREVLDFLVELSRWQEVEPIFLMGNHESMLLRFIEDPAGNARWLRHGGLQTLMSYGVPCGEGTRAEEALTEIGARLSEAMGPHRAFIEGCVPSHRNGNLFFVHAGADPAAAPEDQDPKVLMWGHPAFRSTPRADGLWVVHGHTVVDVPVVEGGRVALDTGAYFSGLLTAARFDPDDITFLTAVT